MTTTADLILLVTRHWLRDAIGAYLTGLSAAPDSIALQNLDATPEEAAAIIAAWTAPPTTLPLDQTNARSRLVVLADAIARGDGNPVPLSAAGWSDATVIEVVTAINKALP